MYINSIAKVEKCFFFFPESLLTIATVLHTVKWNIENNTKLMLICS